MRTRQCLRGGHRRDRAYTRYRERLRCAWAVAGPCWTTSRRAERSSRRGRLAGGPPPPAHTAAGSSGAWNTRGATSTPVETFFAPACGSSTPVEIFFAHAHRKWLIFDHFHRAGAIFLSQRHPERPPGATQGRYFFQAAPSGPPREPAALPGRGAHGWRGLAGQRGDTPSHTPAHQAPQV